MRKIAFALLLAPFAALAHAQSTAQRGITAEDYFQFELVSDPRVSPDGSQVTYVVARVDRAQNRRVPSIWIAPTNGSRAPRVLVDESWSPSAPRWAPDGVTVGFISARAPSDTGSTAARRAPAPRAQLWTVATTGGTPRRVTSVGNGVSNCAWSPDGARAVCLVRTGPSDALPAGKERSDVRHYTQSNYKFNDTGWFDDRRSHLWVVDVATGAARQITQGDAWNDTDPQWSPDGTRIAFVSDRSGHEFDDAGRNPDVWVIPAGGGTLTRISTAQGPDNSPRWSPDGKSIAFVTSPGDEQPQQIMIAPATGGTATTAVPDFDLLPTDLQWGEGGKSLFFDTGVKGESQVFRIDVAARRMTQVTKGPRGVHSVSVAPNAATIVYTSNDFTHLDDVDAANVDGSQERKLSNHNAALWSQLSLMPVERMTYKGADGWDVDGFLVKPLGWQPGRKYPLILSIHGGPAGQYGVDWFHEFQMYAAHGWGVFFTNPRGSTGYGRKFARGIENEWGGKDYVDIMNGVNAAIAANSWIDTTKLGVTGGSYGGYMTNWIVGHTNRFKAAVTLRSISNFISDDATRDGAYGHKDDFGGDIFQKQDLYWDRSPIKYVQNVTTPILILHSDNDFRVPIEQGEQWFRGLKHFGKTAEIVFFPRENHNLTRTGEPKHIVESLSWQLYWFDRYLEGRAAEPPA
ncbi:MAG: peptidase prolyl oligopeptidase active site domain protein [Gemmatimonadetes bacterium]|nr:peptidase prolyl oligopeptidase active site domain protein [Gemmatimonadota bacterium]